MQTIADVALRDILASLQVSLTRLSIEDKESALIAIRKLAAQLESKLLNERGK